MRWVRMPPATSRMVGRARRCPGSPRRGTARAVCTSSSAAAATTTRPKPARTTRPACGCWASASSIARSRPSGCAGCTAGSAGHRDSLANCAFNKSTTAAGTACYGPSYRGTGFGQTATNGQGIGGFAGKSTLGNEFSFRADYDLWTNFKIQGAAGWLVPSAWRHGQRVRAPALLQLLVGCRHDLKAPGERSPGAFVLWQEMQDRQPTTENRPVESTRPRTVPAGWWIGLAVGALLLPGAVVMDRDLMVALRPARPVGLVGVMAWVTWLGYGLADIAIPVGDRAAGVVAGRRGRRAARPDGWAGRGPGGDRGPAPQEPPLSRATERGRRRRVPGRLFPCFPASYALASFPSGHATTAFALATVLSLWYPRGWWAWGGARRWWAGPASSWGRISRRMFWPGQCWGVRWCWSVFGGGPVSPGRRDNVKPTTDNREPINDGDDCPVFRCRLSV